jgi:uncharacterized membrane protein SpoIIM required for sporulation
MVPARWYHARVTEQEFIRTGATAWARTGQLVSAARRDGVGALGPDELIELHDGYRRAAADLAYAQTHFPGTETLAELNALVAGAHGLLYAAPSRRLSRLVTFYAAEVPRLVRDNRRPILLAAGLLVAALAFGFVASTVDPGLGRALLPPLWRDAVSEKLASGPKGAASGGIPASLGPLLSTQIMVNNIQVSFVAFAGGTLAGTATVWMLIQNGLLLGALSGLFVAAGLSLPFFSLIVPHGALELPAIVLAAGAGFRIAAGLLFPGERTRRESLQASANVAVRLLLGILPLIAAAALIEGFLTPSPAPPELKLAFGAALFALLAAWLGLGGRGEPGGTE